MFPSDKAAWLAKAYKSMQDLQGGSFVIHSYPRPDDGFCKVYAANEAPAHHGWPN